MVSYHLMDFENKKVLGVHIEGDKKFNMYKQWGEGDGKTFANLSRMQEPYNKVGKRGSRRSCS